MDACALTLACYNECDIVTGDGNASLLLLVQRTLLQLSLWTTGSLLVPVADSLADSSHCFTAAQKARSPHMNQQYG
eukprot:4187800-Amphidinium_carterae.2